MGGSGTRTPTNGIGANARIAGHGRKVMKVTKVKQVKAVHPDSPSKDVARRGSG
jgi:hypothetical protein